ncbi:MAG: hypothetical protein ACYC4Q_04995 [Victivallaceae bacterium]
MKYLSKNLMLAILILLCITGYGEVFSLWPATEKGNSGNAGDPETALNPKNVWSEPVTINDVKLELSVGLINMRPDELLAMLFKLFPNAQFVYNSNSILVKIKQESGGEKRLLLLSLGENMPVIQFAMTAPKELPSSFTWPSCLPMTGDGSAVKYMYFPKRNAWYGEFNTSRTPAQGLAEITGKISGEGWTAVSKEASSENGGTGDIFLKSKPISVLLVNFNNEGQGLVFTRSLK